MNPAFTFHLKKQHLLQGDGSEPGPYPSFPNEAVLGMFRILINGPQSTGVPGEGHATHRRCRPGAFAVAEADAAHHLLSAAASATS